MARLKFSKKTTENSDHIILHTNIMQFCLIKQIKIFRKVFLLVFRYSLLNLHLLGVVRNIFFSGCI